MPVPVSVVIPFRDAQAYFDEALASVRAQTDPPAEVIVVDDGSGEEGRRFLDARRDGMVLLRFPTGRGPGAARNAGVAVASQPYVAFLDADDRWMPSKLRVQYRFMRARPALDASHTASIASYGGGRQRARMGQPRELSLALALADLQMATPSVMIKRSSFVRIGGFDPRFRCTQDWELQIRMVLRGYRIELIPLPLTWVRREGHGHHSARWRCFLMGHLRVLFRHRRVYVATLGYRPWLRYVTRDLARAGLRQGGWLGRGLAVPHQLGI